MQKELKELQKKLAEVKNVLDAPGGFLNNVCSGATSVFADTKNFFEDKVGGFFRGLGRRRRKRASGDCGIPTVLPSTYGVTFKDQFT